MNTSGAEAEKLASEEYLSLGFELLEKNYIFPKGKQMGEIIKLANQLRDEKELTKEAVLQVVYECSGDSKDVLERLTACSQIIPI